MRLVEQLRRLVPLLLRSRRTCRVQTCKTTLWCVGKLPAQTMCADCPASCGEKLYKRDGVAKEARRGSSWSKCLSERMRTSAVR